jgi:hypothetical protein
MCGLSDLNGSDKSIFDFSMKNAKELAGKGDIDPLEGIKGAPVWQLRESLDNLVGQNQQNASKQFYEALGANLSSEMKEWRHVFAIDDPRQSMQGDCITSSHFCGWDTAGRILIHLLWNLPSSGIDRGNWQGKAWDWENRGTLKPFDQHEFVTEKNWTKTEFTDKGAVYYPHACLQFSCNVHISLHGCFGSTDYWPKEGTGLIHYAASNNIILLFPFVKECYDTKGKTGPNFATKKGI